MCHKLYGGGAAAEYGSLALEGQEVWVDRRRNVVCLNEEQRRKDAADWKAIVKSLRERLGNGGADKELIGNSGYRKFVKVRGEAHYEIDDARIESEAKYDDAIRGHVFCSCLALRLRRELERRLEGLGKPWEWGEVIRGIDKLQEVTLGF